jgi:hypothetical protein
LKQLQYNSQSSIFVGGMYWWTTAERVIEACHNLNVKDVKAVLLFEDRRNGQSQVRRRAEA